jgi:predicted RNase H-like HicB family nuclease
MNRYSLPIIIEKDEDGYYAECPALQGCFTQGETYEEVIENMRDAIELHLQDRQEQNETLSLSKQVSITTLEVAA